MAPERKHRSTRKSRKPAQDHQATAVNRNIVNERHASFNDNNTVGLDNETDTPGDSFPAKYLPHHDPSYEHTAIVDSSSLQHPSSAETNIHHEPDSYSTSPFLNDPLISHQSTTDLYSYSLTTHNQAQHQTQLQNETHSTTFININRPWGQATINNNSNINAILNHPHLRLHQTPTRTSDISPIRRWANSSMHEGPWDALASVPVHGGEGWGLDMEIKGDDGVGEGEEGGSMIYYAPSSQHT
jgi:hypothetical protein